MRTAETAVNPYDVIIIGAGAAGLSAARAARSAGRRVALVEAGRPGGDCTHYGCVPSKALLETARRIAGARDGAAYGFSAPVTVDFPAVMQRVRRVIADIEQDESPEQLARQGIELVAGWARFTSPHSVDVDGRRLTAGRFVLAIGAHAAIPPIPGLDQTPYLDNKNVFALTALPAHLLVLGGGAIGCELAQAFRRLGAQVTLVEAAPTLLVKEEPEAAAVLTAVLAREGVTVRTGAAVERVSRSPDGPLLHLSDGTTVSGTHLLVAVGRAPATGGLSLDVAGVELGPRRAIAVDAYLRTSADHIFAIGDCASALQFTHVGDEQGRLAAHNAFHGRGRPGVLGGQRAFDSTVLPWVTFTDPEIGRVGLSEAEAYQRYGEGARVSLVALADTDRGRAAGETTGFIKLIAAPRPVLKGTLFLQVVGMTAVAPAGGELIAEAALAMRTKALAGRLAQTVHAYPTHSLATRMAASRMFGSYAGKTARPAHDQPNAAELQAVLGER